MAELVAQIILVCSLVGIGVILFRKIPVLVELSETSDEFNLKENFLKLKERIKIPRYFKIPAYETFLQKILSKIRILTLKVENKTASWLQKLRKRSQKKKFKENDNYWEEIKKSSNQEDKNLPG